MSYIHVSVVHRNDQSHLFSLLPLEFKSLSQSNVWVKFAQLLAVISSVIQGRRSACGRCGWRISPSWFRLFYRAVLQQEKKYQKLKPVTSGWRNQQYHRRINQAIQSFCFTLLITTCVIFSLWIINSRTQDEKSWWLNVRPAETRRNVITKSFFFFFVSCDPKDSSSVRARAHFLLLKQ